MCNENMHLRSLLSDLLNSEQLDEDDESEDCIHFFDNYKWKSKDGVDQKDFQRLLQIGLNGNMDKEKLDEFMEMVSSDGEHHLYFVIYESRKAVA